jgi:ParB-like chromosome segregation protein Spo0J
MKIEEIDIEDIKPYENNPRKNEKAIDIVARSIKEFGFKVPVILNKKNVIVAGHTRILAAKILGMKKVPVIYANDLNEKQIKAFRIMENKSQDYSEWDTELLVKEFKILKEGGFDITLTGFSEEDVDSELKLNEVENDNIFDDRHKVIMLLPPEAPRLKEREAFYCKTIEDYNKIKGFFEKSGKLETEKLLGMIK